MKVVSPKAKTDSGSADKQTQLEERNSYFFFIWERGCIKNVIHGTVGMLLDHAVNVAARQRKLLRW